MVILFSSLRCSLYHLSYVSTIDNLIDRSQQYQSIFSTFCGLSGEQQSFLAFRDDLLDEILENVDEFNSTEEIEYLVEVLQDLSSNGYLPLGDAAPIIEEILPCLEESMNNNDAALTAIVIKSFIDGLLSSEDLSHMLCEGIVDSNGYVNIRKADWSNMNDQERLSHIYKWLRFIRKMDHCKPDQGYADQLYKLNGNFFHSVSFSGTSYVMSGTIDVAPPNGNTHLVPVNLEYNQGWSSEKFYPRSPIEVDIIGPNTKYVFTQEGNTNTSFGIVTMYVPDEDASAFLLNLEYNYPASCF